MPLWIKPDRKISAHDVMNFMRDHLEGTPLDMSVDAGAGPFGNPYRWRPLTWKVDDVTYCNERATATQQTGFSFVGRGEKNGMGESPYNFGSRFKKQEYYFRRFPYYSNIK